MNILIVDDENDTRQRIARLLSISDNVFQADNGLEALKLMEKTKIDLILTDICMPIMDGLEMIRMLRGQGESTLVIVMSGYNDFTYAQKAIRYNVIDYLLKPISPIELKKLIENSRNQIKQREYREKYGYQPFFNSLLDGSFTHIEALRQMDVLSLPNSFDYYAVGYVRKKGQNIADIEPISKALKETMPKDINLFVFNRGKNVALIAFISNITESCAEEKLSRIAQKAMDNGIFLFFSSFSKSLDTAPERDKEADFLRKNTLFTNNVGFYSSEDVIAPKLELYTDDELRVLCEKILTLMLSDENIDSLVDELYSVLSLMAINSGYAETYDVLLHLISNIKDILIKHITVEKQKGILFELDEMRRIDNLYDSKKTMKRIIHWLQNEYISNNISPSENIINTIKRRIRENMHIDTFSVQDSIEGLNYSESYIRYIFSNHEGMTIKEYITKERMEKAFSLLKKGTSVKETAEKIGFSNQRYFAKCFKDYIGLTPTEWKNANILKNLPPFL